MGARRGSRSLVDNLGRAQNGPRTSGNLPKCVPVHRHRFRHCERTQGTPRGDRTTSKPWLLESSFATCASRRKQRYHPVRPMLAQSGDSPRNTQPQKVHVTSGSPVKRIPLDTLLQTCRVRYIGAGVIQRLKPFPKGDLKKVWR